VAVGAALLATIGLTASVRPAHAVDRGAAVGIGLSALAIGTALGAAANPNYNPYYYQPTGTTPGAVILLPGDLVLPAEELLERVLWVLLRLLNAFSAESAAAWGWPKGALAWAHEHRGSAVSPWRLGDAEQHPTAGRA
jgi:hypothetical protein